MSINKITLDTKVLDRMERAVPGRADKIIGKLALDCVLDMDQSMSRDSPSAPGGPPAVLTGLLVGSLKAERIKERLWQMYSGTDYDRAQEFGVPALGLPARPFFEPAVRRMAKRAPAALKAVIHE